MRAETATTQLNEHICILYISILRKVCQMVGLTLNRHLEYIYIYLLQLSKHKFK